MRNLDPVLFACLLSLVAVAAGGVSACGDDVWLEDSYADFADGTLDASGQNLYVSRDGKVRTIQRFDLDQDGYLDLIFNSTHDWEFFVPATQGTVAAGSAPFTSQPLPVEGSLRVVLDDLNRDGHTDAIFCPNYSGLQSQRRLLTILWGAADGWSPRRSNGMLPVHAAADVAVCDLNHDDWGDIAVLNGAAWLPGQPAGRIVRIYWGGELGFELTRRVDTGIDGAVDLESGDFDSDGAKDLAVLRSGGKLRVLWGSVGDDLDGKETSSIELPDTHATCLATADPGGAGSPFLVVGTSSTPGVVHVVEFGDGRTSDRDTYPAFPATHIEVDDLDGDRRADLVLTDFSRGRAAGGEAAGAEQAGGEVRVLWGRSNGFHRDHALRLPAPAAACTAIGDIDGDGRSDLAIGIHQGEKTLTTMSLVYLGAGGRQLTRAAGGIESTGATDVVIAPAEGALPARVVFANSLGGTVGERVPLHLYWGGPDGFAADRRTEIPFRSGYESSAADLDADGFVDLVAIDSQHAGVTEDDPFGGANIFWGSAQGFDFEARRTVLREQLLGTSNVADLNRDGWLDLVLGVFGPVSPEEPTPLIIYYGAPEGFRREKRAAVASPGRSIGTAIADFDRDGWLDIAVTSFEKNRVRIFRGGAAGFDASRQLEVAVPAPIGLEVADLNADGRLDVVVGSYRDPVTHAHDMGSLILWGRSDGFRHWDAQRLPAWAPVGHCVADFDGDGHLDLFSPHYVAERMRETLPSYLYWGGPDGFHPRERVSLICDSAHDALAADFDRDGRLDLAVSCHSKDGSHATDSLLFYNDGDRFRAPRVQRLPTHGTHWMWAQDMGHIYDRSWKQTYTSSVHRWNRESSSAEITYRAEVPEGTDLRLAVRAAPTPKGLEGARWQPLGRGPESTAPKASFTLSSVDRHLQYRVEFRSDNGDRYPILDQVRVALER